MRDALSIDEINDLIRWMEEAVIYDESGQPNLREMSMWTMFLTISGQAKQVVIVEKIESITQMNLFMTPIMTPQFK